MTTVETGALSIVEICLFEEIIYKIYKSSYLDVYRMYKIQP
jgi:hypothetical protein